MVTIDDPTFCIEGSTMTLKSPATSHHTPNSASPSARQAMSWQASKGSQDSTDCMLLPRVEIDPAATIRSPSPVGWWSASGQLRSGKGGCKAVGRLSRDKLCYLASPRAEDHFPCLIRCSERNRRKAVALCDTWCCTAEGMICKMTPSCLSNPAYAGSYGQKMRA